jgi:hypothetical protein
MNRQVYLLAFVSMLCGSESALAATALDGASMTWPWCLPFIGILASIATWPLLFPKVWHDHYGKIAFGWAALALACLAIFNGNPGGAYRFCAVDISRVPKLYPLALCALYRGGRH